MVEEDAVRAFDEGGPGGLAAHLRRLDAKLPGKRFLTDAEGRDLVDGSDRSDLLRLAGVRLSAASPTAGSRSSPGPATAAIASSGSPSPGSTSRARPRSSPWSWRSSRSWGPSWPSTSRLPLRRLRRVMDRFGRGDLRARVGSRRRDEIGVVSREFDLLAERVETLVTAERRLLQDVSHELRSPLTRLDVAVDLAIKREDRGPLLERIRGTSRGSRRSWASCSS